jgi:hypothetical protein
VLRCVVGHHGAQLGLVLTLVAWCRTTQGDTKIMLQVKRPYLWKGQNGIIRPYADLRPFFNMSSTLGVNFDPLGMNFDPLGVNFDPLR